MTWDDFGSDKQVSFINSSLSVHQSLHNPFLCLLSIYMGPFTWSLCLNHSFIYQEKPKNGSYCFRFRNKYWCNTLLSSCNPSFTLWCSLIACKNPNDCHAISISRTVKTIYMKKCTLPNKVIDDQEQEHKIRYEFATSSIGLLLEDLLCFKIGFHSIVSSLYKTQKLFVRKVFYIPTWNGWWFLTWFPSLNPFCSPKRTTTNRLEEKQVTKIYKLKHMKPNFGLRTTLSSKRLWFSTSSCMSPVTWCDIIYMSGKQLSQEARVGKESHPKIKKRNAIWQE